MTDKEYWQTCNPKNWDKGTWFGGVLAVAAMALAYFFIVFFH